MAFYFPGIGLYSVPMALDGLSCGPVPRPRAAPLRSTATARALPMPMPIALLVLASPSLVQPRLASPRQSSGLTGRAARPCPALTACVCVSHNVVYTQNNFIKNYKKNKKLLFGWE